MYKDIAKRITAVGMTVIMTISGFGFSGFVNANTTGTNNEETRQFPTMRIETEGIPFRVRELWLYSTFTLEGAGRRYDLHEMTGRVRGRGRSSWSRHPEKRSLAIRFDDRVRMPGASDRHRRWVLVANHQDKTLMRDYAAYHIGAQLSGMYWSPYASFVHLYVNGEYMGVYLLADERNVGPGRAQLTADTNPAVSEYLLQMDWRLYRRGNVEDVDFFRINTSPNGIIGISAAGSGHSRDFLYEVRYPSGDDFTPEHMEYARAFIEAVSHAIRSRDFERISALVDIEAMADYYIVQELFKNVDSGFSSVFLQIKGQGDERRLVMGPLWDFDVAAGNTYWQRNQTPYGLYVGGQHYWFRNLMATPEFREVVTERWNREAFAAIMRTVAHIHYMAETYQGCFERNFERHDIMGVFVWPNPPQVVEIDTFLGQVDYLADFLVRRAFYMNDVFNDN